MRNLSNTNGPVSFCDAPGETGDATNAYKGKAFYQDLISRANTVPIINVFRHYGVRLNEGNRKTTCPFKSHKDGREGTASFYFYPDTNSYCCYGCRIGSKACDFVSEMEKISKVNAANKIISWFGEDVNEDLILDNDSLSERLEIMMDFSNTVREFRKSNFNENSYEYTEYVCSVYDNIYSKHKTLNNDALRRIVDLLKEDIASCESRLFNK